MKNNILFSVMLAILTMLSNTVNAQMSSNGWSVKLESNKAFIENKGQFPVFNKNEINNSEVLYAFDDGQTMIYFKRTGLVYTINKKITKKEDELQNNVGRKKNHMEEEREEHDTKTPINGYFP